MMLNVRAVFALCLVLCWTLPSFAIDFVDGREFQDQLHVRVGLEWSQNPISDGLSNLSRAQKLAIRLDRRIPPKKRVDLQIAPQTPLWRTLDQLTENRELDWAWLGNVIYVGPKHAAIRLGPMSAELRQQIKRLPAAKQGQLLSPKPLRWPRLTRPRDLMKSWLDEVRLPVDNLDRIPHDLWPESDFPALPWADRVTLILNEFDLALAISPNGEAARLVEVDDAATTTRDYSTPPRFRLETLQKDLPNIRVARRSGRLTVVGAHAEHQQVVKWLLAAADTKPANPGAGAPMQVYDLRIDGQPVGGVIKALAQKLGWTPAVTQAAARKLNERISFALKGATAEELIEATVKPAGLAYRLRGNRLEIYVPGE